MVKAVVYKNHTLGLLRGNTLEVLHGMVSKGGVHYSQSPITVFEEECKPATVEDFKRFKVRCHPDYNVESQMVYT